MARHAALLAGLALLGASVRVAAAPAPAALPVRVQLAAVECSSSEAFFEAVRARSARVRQAGPNESAALLEVLLERSPLGMRGDLRLRLEDGTVSTRSVTGASCEAVVDALSLTAALALDSAPVEATPNEPSAPSEAVPSDSPPPAESAAPKSRQASRVRAELGVQAAVARVVAPHLNVGAALAARLRLERSSVLSPTLGLALLHTDNGLFESSRHAAMRFSGAVLSLCPLRLRSTRFAFEPCVTALGASLRAEGRDLVEARAVTRSWWGAGAHARGALALSSALQVGVEAGVLVPLVERAFVALPGQTSLGRTPAAAPFANVGIYYAL